MSSLEELTGREFQELYSVDLPTGATSTFGASCSVSADGMTMAVGDPDANKVFIYSYSNTGRWALWKTIERDEVAIPSVENFGASVAISSNGLRVCIGFADDTVTYSAGVAVYQYQGNGDNTHDFTYRHHRTRVEEEAGYTMAMLADGTLIAIASKSGTGRVHLFSLPEYTTAGSPSVLFSTVNAYDESVHGESTVSYIEIGGTDQFGRSLALAYDGTVGGSNYVLAVGEADNVYTFGINASGVIPSGSFATTGTAVKGSNDTGLGFSVAMSEDGLLLVAGKYIPGDSSASSVQTFTRDALVYSWTNTVTSLEQTSDNNMFGYAVALSPEGDVLAMTSMNEISESPSRGTVNLYKKNSDVFSSWTHINSFGSSGVDTGRALSLSRPRNNLVIVMATAPNSGRFTTYELTSKSVADWTAMKAVPRYVLTIDDDTTDTSYRYGRFKSLWNGKLGTGMEGWTYYKGYIGHDGYVDALGILSDRSIGHDFKNNGYGMNGGQRACAMSHIELWTYLSEQTSGTASAGKQHAWIFEDDALPCSDFDNLADALFTSAPDDWDMIYFGHGSRRSITDVDGTLTNADDTTASQLPVRCLHAYALTDVGAWRLMNWLRAYNRFGDNMTDDAGIPKIDDVVTMLHSINVFVTLQASLDPKDALARVTAWSFIKNNAGTHGLTAVPNSKGSPVNFATANHSDVLDACTVLAREYPFVAYVWHKEMSSSDKLSLYENSSYSVFESSYGTNAMPGGFIRDRGLVYQDDYMSPERGKGAIHGGYRYVAP